MIHSVPKNKIEQVIVKYADMIFRIAYQNLKSKADAEDIFQEVCVTLLTKNPPLDDEKHLKYWLIRVTINKCNNFHKSFWHNKISRFGIIRLSQSTNIQNLSNRKQRL